jgi:hypothetical protein
MAIGRISGSVLKSNLTRNGTDLAFETNLLYLDVTNSRVGIGTSEPSTTLDINGTVNATTVTAGTLAASGTGTDALLTLTTTNITGTASPKIDLKRINPNEANDNDKIGQINFIGEATDSSSVTYGRITTSIFDSQQGSMDGKMQIMLQEGGTLTNAVRIESTGIFLNTGNYIEFEGSRKLYLTSDSIKLDKDKHLVTFLEGKNTSTKKFPTLEDIKDGLIKLMIFKIKLNLRAMYVYQFTGISA